MRAVIAALLIVGAAPALAEVKEAAPEAFLIESTVEVAAPPAMVWQRLVVPAGWWDGAHSYSGDAANLTIEPRAGGCFCERVPAEDATVEHARILYAAPTKLLRLSGGLGPLQAEGATGTLSFALAEAPGGGTRVTMRYAVGGYLRGQGKQLAPAVDGVLTHQLTRLKAAAESGPARR